MSQDHLEQRALFQHARDLCFSPAVNDTERCSSIRQFAPPLEVRSSKTVPGRGLHQQFVEQVDETCHREVCYFGDPEGYVSQWLEWNDMIRHLPSSFNFFCLWGCFLSRAICLSFLDVMSFQKSLLGNARLQDFRRGCKAASLIPHSHTTSTGL